MKKTEINWKQDLPEFREKTAAFYAGEMDKGAYKGFSGYYGSYAQKGGKASMLRLRMPAGRVTRATPAAAVYLRDLCAILQNAKSDDAEVKKRCREVQGASASSK